MPGGARRVRCVARSPLGSGVGRASPPPPPTRMTPPLVPEHACAQPVGSSRSPSRPPTLALLPSICSSPEQRRADRGGRVGDPSEHDMARRRMFGESSASDDDGSSWGGPAAMGAGPCAPSTEGSRMATTTTTTLSDEDLQQMLALVRGADSVELKLTIHESAV